MYSLQSLIDLSLLEDIGVGDITTDAIVADSLKGKGTIVAKEELVVAGLEVAGQVFKTLDADVRIHSDYVDGDTAGTGDIVMTVDGALAILLKGERTALNFLQRLSGIATLTRHYVSSVSSSPVCLLDTRKTTPGFRVIEKQAVRSGGGRNHRMGLFDGVLIKDNHIAVAGGIAAAVRKVREKITHLIKIEVEVEDLNGVEEALDAGADVIMLDNMMTSEISAAVQLIDGRAGVEVSGNITIDRLPELAETGVNYISVGALTHSARAMDLSMRISADTT